jgi:Endosomal/lysosomal potassium channel TMEM175
MNTSADIKDSHRLQVFSDAVFAFACTLLVVSLEVPKTFAELRTDLQGFVAFGLAFTVLIYIWSIHYRLYSRFPLSDDWSIVINSCLLFVVLFFVYPLKFLANQLVSSLFGIGVPPTGAYLSIAELRSLFVIYGGAYAAVFALFSLLYWRASRFFASENRLDLLRATAHDFARHYLVIACVAGLSMLMALLRLGLNIGLPGWIYFLIGPASWVNRVLTNRRRLRPR